MSLVAHYKMNDCALSTEIKNSVSLPHAVAARNTNSTAVAGKIGRAQSFNGSSDKITCGTLLHSTLQSTGKLSINLWYKAPSSGWGGWLWSSYGDSHNGIQGIYDEEIGFRADGIAVEEIEEIGGTFEYTFTDWCMYTWVLEQVTVNSFSLKMFINGVEEHTSTHVGTITNLLSATTYVGALSGFNLAGDLDNFMVFNHALSTTEISSLYNGGSGTEIIVSDPLSYLHDALWSILEADSDFTDLVKVGNRIKFSGQNRSPEKDETITEDFPEVRIVVLNSTPHLYSSSNSCSLMKQFAVQVCTGDQRLDAVQFQLEWIIYRCMARNMTSLLALEWNSKKFIMNVKPTSVRDSMAYDATLKPGIRGWISLWAIDINMSFSTSDM